MGRKVVGSLLLGLYDSDGLLHHVGFSSGKMCMLLNSRGRPKGAASNFLVGRLYRRAASLHSPICHNTLGL
jgi:hypothetical protein